VVRAAGVATALALCSPGLAAHAAAAQGGASTLAAGEENLAVGKPAWASSTLRGNPPSAAVDDSVDTAWRTGGSQEWWQVDLGRATTISAVVVNWDAGQLPASYVMLLSPDGREWTQTGDVYERPNGGPTVLELAPTKARFVRLETGRPASPAGIALRDIRLFAAAPAAGDAGQAEAIGSVGAVGRIPGVGPQRLTPDDAELIVPDQGGLVPPPAEASDDASIDPVSTAAVIVIVAAGVTGLVFGAQRSRGRHRAKRRLPGTGSIPIITGSIPVITGRAAEGKQPLPAAGAAAVREFAERAGPALRRYAAGCGRLAVQARQALPTISSMSWRIAQPRSRRASSPEATMRAGSPGRRSRSSGSNPMPVTRRTAAMISSTDSPSPLPRL
jgi:hypothetical protein